MLHLYQSNRLEALAGELARLTRAPLARPFAPEIVLVQSQGVARWLALALARHTGICANVRFLFPAAFAWSLYRTLGELPASSPYERGVMAWRILQLLPSMEPLPEFGPVRAYVCGDPFRRYDLACRIAESFEQYLVYRPDWIAQWERGEAPHWQGQLWRRVAQQTGVPHRARLHRQLLARIDGELLRNADVPERVSVFGAPALPPMLLELLVALAGHLEVHLLLSNPCREYWGDITAAGEVARKQLARSPVAAYLETGNRLLASLGKQGRDFFELLQAHSAHERDHYVDAGEAHLLGALQSDVLNLREGGAGNGAAHIAADDRSIQVHACHGAMREVEVLHDQLLALFERHEDLGPSDVVVMAPDIESYAPYVEAVFATAQPRIPFNISDRSAERQSALAATFMALLALPASRYEAGALLEILDEPAVQRRFGLTAEDVDIVHGWVRASGIRWGIDAAHRASFDLPATTEHTWRFGLDRLLLGYAMPGGNERLFGDILPYDEVEGSLGAILGGFASFAEAAIALNGMPRSLTVPQWARALRGMLARFFEPAEHQEEEMEALRAAIAALESEAATGGFEDPLACDAARSALLSRLQTPGGAFLAGGVTFCAMVPMRSLPFEIVCLLGMNDGAFPRVRRPYGFDLMTTDFRKGDRSRRDDDRYLFLESLLSARRCFYVSYTGQHIRDNSVLPPSVLVSELLDYLADNFRAPSGADIRAHVVTRHPLQPFSPRYFAGDARLFSYSASLCEAAKVAGRGGVAPEPFIAGTLPEPEAEWRVVALEALIRFFRNPARALLRERLGIRLEEADEQADGREPLVSGALESYALKQRLLAVRLRGAALQPALPVARASGLLPHARVGAVVFERASAEVEAFAEVLLEALPGKTVEPLGFDLDLGGMRLHGALAGVSPAGLLGYRFGKCRARDLLDAWLRHLVLNLVAPPGVKRHTRWILQDEVLRLRPVPDAPAVLGELMALYWEGLLRPLHFFPESARAYIEKDCSIVAARGTWQYSEHSHGEGEDPYYRLAFRGRDPLDEDFAQLAGIVFGPMKAAMDEEGRA